MARFKFRLTGGAYVGRDAEGKSTSYKKGAIVESDNRLDKTFPLKFKLIGADPDKPDEQPKRKRGPLPPEAFDDEDFDDAPSTEGKEGGADMGAGDDDGSASPSPLGEDVTAEFDKASKAGVRVFKSGSKYFVAATDEPAKALTKAGLTKRDATKYVADYAKG